MRKAAIPGLLVLAVLRLPSLMEPHWYTDEAGYLNVARQLLQGKILYLQTWNNKPPLMLWTFALDVKLFGTSEIALHVLTLITGAITVAAVVWAASRLYTPRRALIAGVIAARDPGPPDRRRRARASGEPADRAADVGGRDHPRAHPSRRSDRGAAAVPRVGARRRACSWPLRSRISRPRSRRRRRSSSRCCSHRRCCAATPLIFIATVVVITLAWLTLAISTAGPR